MCNVLEHVLGNASYSVPSAVTGLSRSLLQTSLDGIDGSVAEGTHGTGDKTDDGGLPAGQVGALVLGLEVLEPLLEVGVGSEVDGLVGTLAESSETDTAVEGAEAFLLDDGVESVSSVAVLGDVHWVGHGVVLGLQTDLDDFHGSDDGDGLCDTGGETGEESSLSGDDAVFVGEHLLVGLKGCEADGHLGDDSGQDGAETLVQSQRGFLFHNLDTGLDEAAARGAGCASATGQLHADLDCVFAVLVRRQE